MKKTRITIQLDGKDYPCYETMGGNVLFEEATGANMLKGVNFDTINARELCTFFWARCKGACKREKIEFPYDLEAFIDAVEEGDLLAAINAMVSPLAEATTDGDAPKNV